MTLQCNCLMVFQGDRHFSQGSYWEGLTVRVLGSYWTHIKWVLGTQAVELSSAKGSLWLSLVYARQKNEQLSEGKWSLALSSSLQLNIERTLSCMKGAPMLISSCLQDWLIFIFTAAGEMLVTLICKLSGVSCSFCLLLSVFFCCCFFFSLLYPLLPPAPG